MKKTGIIGTIEFMGLSRPVRYEEADLTISNLGFAEAELVIKILEGLKHGSQAKPVSPVVDRQVEVSASEIAKATKPKPKVEPASELESEPEPETEPETEPEPAPKKKRGRKKKPPKKRSKKKAPEPEPTPEPEPEPEPDQTDLEEYIEDKDTDEEEIEETDLDADSDVPVIKVTKEIKSCKTVRAVIDTLMDQGLDGAQTRAWLLKNGSEIPVLSRLGSRLPERLDRLAKLTKVPGLGSSE